MPFIKSSLIILGGLGFLSMAACSWNGPSGRCNHPSGWYDHPSGWYDHPSGRYDRSFKWGGRDSAFTAILTPEQKEKLDGARQQMRKTRNEVIDSLTPEQKEKLAARSRNFTDDLDD